jgi:hypothetical protein
MKVTFDDTIPTDERNMKLLGALMAATPEQQKQIAQILGLSAKAAAQSKPVANNCHGAVEVLSAETVKPAVVSVPDPEQETADEDQAAVADAPEVDADGVEWDEELHASTKTKTKDGRWKKRRGAADKVDASTEETAPAAESKGKVTIDEFRAAWIEHKGKKGIDRSSKLLADTIEGAEHPSAVPEERWGEIIEALKKDLETADTSGVNVDDFC